jgi:hypothetical protein
MSSDIKTHIKQPYYNLMYKASIGWNDHMWKLPPELLEKFAELIVQECISQVEQAKNSPFVSFDDANRMEHFVDVTKKKIVKHFGIEN